MTRRDVGAAAITGDKKAASDLWFERRWGAYRPALTLSSDGTSVLHSRPCDIPRVVDFMSRSVRWPVGKGVHFLTVASGDLCWWLSQSCLEPGDGVNAFDRRALQLWDASTGEPIHTFDDSSLKVKAMALSEDAATAIICLAGSPPTFWHIDWELEAHDADAVEQGFDRVRRHLENFLDARQRGVYPIDVFKSDQAAMQIGKAHRQQRKVAQWHWSDDQLNELLAALGRIGYGFISKDAIRQELERLRADVD